MTKNTIKYKILKKHRLVVRYFQGQLDLNILYSLLKKSTNDRDYDSTYFGLIDIRDSEFIIDVDSILQFVERILSNDQFQIKKKLIFLTSEPNHVVFSTFVQKFSDRGMYDIQVFSTLNPGLKFLNIDSADFESINQILNSMKESH